MASPGRKPGGYKPGTYTNYEGGRRYDDTIAAIKVIAIIAFLLWFGFG